VTWLLDSSVLIALTYPDHTANDRCAEWFVSPTVTRFATCPITEGALVRLTLGRRPDLGIRAALSVLDSIVADPRHEFWTDDLPVAEVNWTGVVGHRQVTDAYLAELARRRGGRLITLDTGLATLHADVAHLVDPSGP
jgi:uncharacterized protein